MKNRYIAFTVLALIIITVTAQNMSIFTKATRSGWYPEFLYPVMEAITIMGEKKEILDIGTGPGTLPQLLIMKDSGLQVTGIDIDSAMINEAKRRFIHNHVKYQNQKINESLEYDSEQFDVVTFCSVLFLVDDSIRTNLMNEALRVLKPNGKVFILTPSGKKSVLSSFIEIWRYPFSFNNFTFPIWKIATTRRGREWQREKWLKIYARDHHLNYTSTMTFNDNAVLETISKSILINN